MTNARITTAAFDSTTELLQEELPRLEERQQALQAELSLVTEQLGSVRNALSALQALSSVSATMMHTESSNDAAQLAPSVPDAAPLTGTITATPKQPAPTPAEPAKARLQRTPRTSSSSSRKAVTPKRRRSASISTSPKRSSAKKSAAENGSSDLQAEGLTKQVIAVLATHSDTPMRARDVAAELGRDDSTSAINSVRSTLDRLVATSRALRAGRGLYQAPAT